MPIADIHEPLLGLLKTSFHSGVDTGPEWGRELAGWLAGEAGRPALFQRQFAALINERQLGAADYHLLTDILLSGDERLHEYLVDRWQDIYGADSWPDNEETWPTDPSAGQ